MPVKNSVDYFDMFVKGADYALRAAILLKEMFDCGQLLQSKISAIKNIERDADKHKHMICDYLSNAFITPLDKEDIYAIARETDDLTDCIDSAAGLLSITRLSGVTYEMCHLANYIAEACAILKSLMAELKKYKKSARIKEYAVEINQIVKTGENYCWNAMGKLYRNEKDVLELIKAKEVYEELRYTLKKSGELAEYVQKIVITKT